MAKRRRQGRAAKKWLHDLDKKVRVMRRRRAREAEEEERRALLEAKVAALRAQQRVEAKAALERLEPFAVSKQRAEQLRWIADKSWMGLTFPSSAYGLALMVREVLHYDVVRYVALGGMIFGLFGSIILAACSPFLYNYPTRQLVGQWMIVASAALGLLTIILWNHIWVGLGVMLTAIVWGILLFNWGASYRQRLRELAR